MIVIPPPVAAPAPDAELPQDVPPEGAFAALLATAGATPGAPALPPGGAPAARDEPAPLSLELPPVPRDATEPPPASPPPGGAAKPRPPQGAPVPPAHGGPVNPPSASPPPGGAAKPRPPRAAPVPPAHGGPAPPGWGPPDPGLPVAKPTAVVSAPLPAAPPAHGGSPPGPAPHLPPTRHAPPPSGELRLPNAPPATAAAPPPNVPPAAAGGTATARRTAGAPEPSAPAATPLATAPAPAGPPLEPAGDLTPAGSLEAADRVARLVEEQARLVPPRTMVVELPELPAVRLRVAVTGTEVHVTWHGSDGALAPGSDAAAELRAWAPALAEALSARGLDLAAFGDEASRRDHPASADEQPPPTRTRSRPARRPAPGLRL